jgi:hypothetical protein
VLWRAEVRARHALAESLNQRRDEAALYKLLATLRFDVPLEETLEDLLWRGARRPELEALAAELGDLGVLERVPRWRDG